MNLNEYQVLALRTAPMFMKTLEPVAIGHNPKSMVDIRHAVLGFTIETGKLADIVKRHDFYAKTPDWTNTAEEVGDLLWYCAIACRGLGISLDSVAEANIAKLKKRYPDKFTVEAAINRDTDAERKTLESVVSGRTGTVEEKLKQDRETDQVHAAERASETPSVKKPSMAKGPDWTYTRRQELRNEYKDELTAQTMTTQDIEKLLMAEFNAL